MITESKTEQLCLLTDRTVVITAKISADNGFGCAVSAACTDVWCSEPSCPFNNDPRCTAFSTLIGDELTV